MGKLEQHVDRKYDATARKRTKRRNTAADRQQMREMFLDGLSVTDIAAAVGIPVMQVWLFLFTSDTKIGDLSLMRARDANMIKQKSMRDMFLSGESSRAIALELHVPVEAVERYLFDMTIEGVPLVYLRERLPIANGWMVQCHPSNAVVTADSEAEAVRAATRMALAEPGGGRAVIFEANEESRAHLLESCIL